MNIEQFLNLGTTDVVGQVILCYVEAVLGIVGCLEASPVSTH